MIASVRSNKVLAIQNTPMKREAPNPRDGPTAFSICDEFLKSQLSFGARRLRLMCTILSLSGEEFPVVSAFLFQSDTKQTTDLVALIVLSKPEGYGSTCALGQSRRERAALSSRLIGGEVNMRIKSAVLIGLAVVAVAITCGVAPAIAASTVHHVDPMCHTPEPASIALLGSGMVTLGGFIRRRLGK
jgi:hypothetical protein